MGEILIRSSLPLSLNLLYLIALGLLLAYVRRQEVSEALVSLASTRIHSFNYSLIGAHEGGNERAFTDKDN